MRRNHQQRNVYANAAKTRQPLTREQLQVFAPSIFARTAFPGVSERYTFIPTFEVLERLMDAGFVPVMAGQSRFRVEGKGEYAKHIVRFQKHDDVAATLSGDSAPLVPEVALVNSHDRSSGFALSSGMFRKVCANGLIAYVEDANISVRHSGQIAEAVLEATRAAIEVATTAIQRAKQLSSIPIIPSMQRRLAERAMEVRWGDVSASPFGAEKLLEARRWIDAYSDDPNNTHPTYGAGSTPKRDLFTTMNVIQENIMKGGIEFRSAKGRRNSTRAINSVTEDIRINKLLWKLAEEAAPKLLRSKGERA